ncbi:MAG: heat-inducible transcriptional repressor HrcA [Clostridiales bacterium]|nr:heat-inducible transcriptional repressor HrcA [Clostridiales bacterium]
MLLNDRKIKILEAIINDYIQTAEPIGSRTIAKKYGLGISSATIRNEMSDLEELGLIIQPHASAGRVPSDKGYRLYVDTLMRTRELTPEEVEYLRILIAHNMNKIDYLMQETAKAISILTNYMSIVTEPYPAKTQIKHIQLIPMDDVSILMVLVTNSKTVKNHIIRLGRVPSYEKLLEFSEALNHYLAGDSVENIDAEKVTKLLGRFGEYGEVLSAVLEAVINSMRAEDNVQVYTSGVKNILSMPEFNNVGKAKAIFQALEEREILATLLGGGVTDDVQILIGAENDHELMKDCSLIKARYKLDGDSYGHIGIIGPTRMNYVQVASILKGIVKNINSIVKALTGG